MYGRTGVLSPRYGILSPKAVGVSLYTLGGELVKTFPSQTAAARYLGVSPRAISFAIKLNAYVKRNIVWLKKLLNNAVTFKFHLLLLRHGRACIM